MNADRLLLPRRRLAVVLTHPVQYFKPIFQGLALDSSIELQVFFGCDHGLQASLDPDFGVSFAWDSKPTEGFPHSFLSQLPLAELARPSQAFALARRARDAIAEFDPEAVLIFSYSPLFITFSTWLLAQQGRRLWLRAETTDRALDRSPRKDRLRSELLRRYYRLFEHLFPISSNSRDHYLRLGVHEAKLSTVPYSVDTDFFQQQVEHWAPRRQDLRQELGLRPEDHVLLFVGKISEVKNPLLISDALALLQRDPAHAPLLERLHLLVVGEGVLRPGFESSVAKLLPGRTHFMGFRNQRELGRYYAMANTLVLPSQQGETWGLVVNEALQFGLGVICSDRVGSARDLVANRRNCIVFPSRNASQLAAAIASIVIDRGVAPMRTEPELLPHPLRLVEAITAQLSAIPPAASSTASPGSVFPPT